MKNDSVFKADTTLRPGQPGTKQWIEKYGDQLLYVRYRYDNNRTKRMTTVEIIVNQADVIKREKHIPVNKIQYLRILPNERNLQKLVKSVGGIWNPLIQLWELPYREILDLGLENRMIFRKMKTQSYSPNKE